MRRDLERPWQIAFEMAWDAYKNGSILIWLIQRWMHYLY